MLTSPTCQHDASKLCEPACAADTGAACASTGLISLLKARERFAAEATTGMCSTGRYQCAYWSWGNGPPLIFIHGLADRAASFLLPASLLAQQFRCIAYDLPEGGGDAAPLRRYTHADLVADLGAILDHLQLDRAYLFGSSFGSTIALEAMRLQPSRYPRAMLQGGFARRPLHLGEWLLASSMRFSPGKMRHLPFRNRGLVRHCKGPLAERADVWQFFLECAGTPRIQAVARRALLLSRLDLRSTLAEVRQPVLLICGDNDPLVGKTCEQELLQGLPSAERIEIPGCGHYPYFSHPELLAEIVKMFLTPSRRESKIPKIA